MRVDNNLNTAYIKDDLHALSIDKEFSAQVMQNGDGKATIRLPNGQVVEALLKTDVKINTGDVLNLQVKDTSDGKIELKLLGKAADSSLMPKNTDELSLLNTNDGIKNGKLDILELLSKNNLIGSKELATAVKEFQGLFKGASVEDIIFLMSNDIEVNEDNVNLLKQVNDNKMMLGKNIADMDKAVKLVLKDMPEIEYNIENLSHKYFGEGYKNTMQKLLPFSNNLKGELLKENSDNLKALNNMLNDITTLINSREVSAQTKAMFGEISRDVTGTVNFFEKLNQNYLHMVVPVLNNGESRTAQILIKNRQKTKKYGGDEPLNIFFALNTQNMGEVKIFMTYINKTLSLEFKLRDSATVLNIKDKQDELIQSLKELSLNIANIKVDVDLEKGVPLSTEIDNNRTSGKSKSYFDFKV